MFDFATHIWKDYVAPIWRRPDRVQFAALCYRDTGGAREVLLITSRDTGRWVLPKGWPMTGRGGAEAARQEAWEEAGLERGETGAPLGSYNYAKGLRGGWAVPVRVTVYPIRVESLAEDWPEAHQRRREWVSPEVAATRVRETDLRNLLLQFASDPSPLGRKD